MQGMLDRLEMSPGDKIAYSVGSIATFSLAAWSGISGLHEFLASNNVSMNCHLIFMGSIATKLLINDYFEFRAKELDAMYNAAEP